VGSRRGHLALAGAVLAGTAVVASSASGMTLRVLIKHTPNKTESNRTRATIRAIVIHDTEGRFIGSVRFLQRARTRGSAHFVVSRRGQIVQLVPVTDVAWHSGNSWWNLHSIGIEHEGWAGWRAYTEREYRASAQLVAYLAHRWGIPLDREHVIGHNEVPNPYRRGRFGGADGHTDPGRFWNWGHYMHRVRYYAAHRVHPEFVRRMTVLPDAPAPRRGTSRTFLRRTVVHATRLPVTPLARAAVSRSTVDRNATVHGKALWWSGVDSSTRWRRQIWKVDFLVDGKTLYTDHTWPYSFHRTLGWNSRTVPNGRHMLSVRLYGARHYRVRKSIPVRVANAPLRIKLTGAVSGGAVSGLLALDASTSELVDRITLYVDGKPVSRDASYPYRLLWDTTRAAEGEHTLLVYARGIRRAALTVPVVVANAPEFPTTMTRNWVAPRAAETSFGVVTPER
jgi:N-acetyl-anhydromuramyl-L-alanine amidase AmpD